MTNIYILELEYMTSKMHMEISDLRPGVTCYVSQFKDQGTSVRGKLLFSSLQSKTIFQI